VFEWFWRVAGKLDAQQVIEMRKYFALAVVVLVIFGSVLVQWLRTERELDRLYVRILGLQRDLQYISQARSKLPEIQDMRADEMNTIQVLHRRIPSEPMVDSFLQTLAERFTKVSDLATPSSRDRANVFSCAFFNHTGGIHGHNNTSKTGDSA
jgi:hypothetical protein